VLLYVERWLKAPVQMEDGRVVPRTAGTPQGGVMMMRTYPHIPFERYADDAICHCKTAVEAEALRSALADRLAACKLVLHPEKTKIVYCKDANRHGDFSNQSLTFSGSDSEQEKPGKEGVGPLRASFLTPAQRR
jgi:RNA-directed DNA polymerase